MRSAAATSQRTARGLPVRPRSEQTALARDSRPSSRISPLRIDHTPHGFQVGQERLAHQVDGGIGMLVRQRDQGVPLEAIKRSPRVDRRSGLTGVSLPSGGPTIQNGSQGVEMVGPSQERQADGDSRADLRSRISDQPFEGAGRTFRLRVGEQPRDVALQVGCIGLTKDSIECIGVWFQQRLARALPVGD